jgi:hypothetical protein
VLAQLQVPALAAGTPPPAPEGINAGGNANTTVSLSWAPTPGATSYHIYRGTAAGGEGATPIATVTGTSYTDTNVTGTPIYFYEITAVNSAGESPRSEEDATKTPPPIGTGGNNAGVASGNSLIFYGNQSLLGGFDWFQTLTGWFPQVLGSSGSNSPGKTVIDMAYATGGSMTFNNVTVPTAGLYTLTWRYAFASGLFPGVTNRQMGVAVNGTVLTSTGRFPITGSFETYQNSSITAHLNAGKNSVSLLAVSTHGVSRVDQLIVTPATTALPSGPANLTSTTGSGTITLHWTGSTTGSPTSYSIYRGTKSDGEATTAVGTTNGTTTTFTDTGLTNSTTYFYEVVANNAQGNSPDSNEIMATPGVTVVSGTNLALNQPAYTSSSQGAGTPATAVVDDNFNSRWSSAASDPQWLEVDLGATHAISQVALYWESAYGKAFQIQTSTDGTNWTTIYSTTTGTGGTQILSVSGSGRFIRMYGTARGTGYGYSLWEFQVFGT